MLFVADISTVPLEAIVSVWRTKLSLSFTRQPSAFATVGVTDRHRVKDSKSLDLQTLKLASNGEVETSYTTTLQPGK